MFQLYDQLREISRVLCSSEASVVITSHVKPDADAVGSALGLGLSLRAAGRRVYFCFQDCPSKALAFLPGATELMDKGACPGSLPENAILFVLDCNELSRIGNVAEGLVSIAKTIFVLDHHIQHSVFLDEGRRKGKMYIECCDTGACATCAIVYRFLELSGLSLTTDVALNLYAGLLTDTGCFCHNNTEAETFEIAAALARLGVVPNHLTQALFQHYPLSRLRLLGETLSGFEMVCHDKAAVMCITSEMYRRFGASEDDSHDFVSFIREIDTVEVAIFIKEFEPGVVVTSLRSKKYFDVEALARSFGGGGHFNAAGFKLKGVSAENVRKMIVERLEASLS